MAGRGHPFSLLCCAAFLSACSISAEPVAVPTAGLTPAMGFSQGADQPGLPMVGSAWWRGLGSDELNGLVDQVIAANPDLAAASLRVLQSTLDVANTRSQGAPSVTAGLTGTTTSAVTALTGDRDVNSTGDLNTTAR